MNNKKGPVVVTGGSGFIGESLIDHLHENYSLIILDKNRPSHLPHDVEFKRTDISSKESLFEVMDEIKKERGEYLYSVIHLAAFYDPEIKEDPRYEAINIRGTKLLIEKLFKDFDVGQFIYSSSISVYGPSNSGYARSKKECENVILGHQSRIPSVILRIAPVYDEFGHAPLLVKEITSIYEMSLSTLIVHANDKSKLTHIHVDDLVEIFCRTIEHKGHLPTGTILNAGENITLAFSEIRKMVTHEILGRDDVLNVPSFVLDLLKLSEHFNYEMDNSKTRKALNWNPTHSLREMIPIMVQNLINYPGTWYRMNKLERQLIITNLKKKFLRPVLSA